MSDTGVWIVERGDYELSVMCACPSEKAAKAVCDKYNADPGTYQDARVSWLPKVTANVRKVETLSLSVNLWDDGTADDPITRVRSEWPFDMLYSTPHAAEWRWVRAPVHEGVGGRLDVFGVDHAAARQVFEDKRTQIESDPSFRKARERKGHVAKPALLRGE